MATYQLSNTATQINNFLTGYIHKDSTNIFAPSKDSFVCAGLNNNTTTGLYSIIGGGLRNTGYSNYSSIIGGQDNFISGNHSSIGGGRFNTGLSNYCFIGGGDKNNIQISGNQSFIGGGASNSIATGAYSTIVGGLNHTISGEYCSILGGRQAKISFGHNGAAVLADGQVRDHFSKGAQTCSLDFANGVYLRLPTFAGIKTQTGNIGELKVSGQFLYIATGQDTWGRVQISSF